jgi:DNA-binding CsgD family transcriptional regulator
MDAENMDAAGRWSRRALAVSKDLDDDATRRRVQVTMHTAAALSGEEGAREQLEACREAAVAAGAQDEVARTWVQLVWEALRRRAYDVADADLTAGLDHARQHSVEIYEIYLTAFRAWWQLDRGEWDAAVTTAGEVLRHTRVSRLPRILGQVVTGLVLARRGEPGARELLDDALAMAHPSGELQRVAPAAAARAELAWLEGDAETVDRITSEALALAVDRDAVWIIGELAALRSLAGLETEPRAGLPLPFAAQMAGDASAATEFWEGQGCVYHACLCRIAIGDEDALRRALADLQALEAARTAAVAARRLREQGVQGVPRGPRPSSARNPAGLTRRELEVLELLAEGLQNREIAQRLYLSHRTVDSHVRAILRKLDARTRSEAAAAAFRLGVAGESQ